MDVVRQGECGQCGYDLTGLSMVGRCPECGHEYDGHSRTGFGSSTAARQARLDRTMARLRTGCLLGVAVLALSCAGFTSLVGWGEPAKAFAVALLCAAFFGLAALLSHLSEKSDP